MINTDSVAVATFPIARRRCPIYSGDTAIAGVPGTAAAIRLDFDDIAGGSCGALLPTGHAVDTIAGTEVTLIDNGMPVVVLRAADLDVDRLRGTGRARGERAAALAPRGHPVCRPAS